METIEIIAHYIVCVRKKQVKIMNKVVNIGYNAVIAKLYTANLQAIAVVDEQLRYKVDGCEYSDAYKEQHWDGTSSFLSKRKMIFPSGFVTPVASALRSKGYIVNLITPKLPEHLGEMLPDFDEFGYTKQYDYQPLAVEELIHRRRMIARLPTGAGKSRVAQIAIHTINRPCLFLTKRTILADQFKRSCEELGMSVGVMGDGSWNPDPMLNVGIVQTFARRIMPPTSKKDGDDRRKLTALETSQVKRKRDEALAFLATVEFLIGEEVHETSAKEYFTVTNACKNAWFRLGLTGTPFLSDNTSGNMRLMASFGQIGIYITEKELIDRGILARPIFKYVSVEPPTKLKRHSNWRRAEEIGIINNEGRNRAILKYALDCKDIHTTSMILVQRKKHGHILHELLSKNGLKVKYVYGDHSREERRRALKALQKGEIDCLIGSTILDAGVDVPAVSMIILAGGGKAQVNLRQRIGRGLRAKKNGPNICFIIDFIDETNKHLSAHAASRRGIVMQIEGFAENILPNGEDIVYEKYGFTK